MSAEHGGPRPEIPSQKPIKAPTGESLGAPQSSGIDGLGRPTEAPTSRNTLPTGREHRVSAMSTGNGDEVRHRLSDSDLPDPLAPPTSRKAGDASRESRKGLPPEFVAYRELTDTLTARVTDIHEGWKAENGYEGQTWEEVLASPEQAGLDAGITPGDIIFEPVWQQGSLLGGEAIQLKALYASFDPTSEAHLEYARQQDQIPMEQRYGNELRTLAAATRSGEKVDNVHIYFFPDSPPQAIYDADVRQAGHTVDDSAAIPAVREMFGEEAVPLLSVTDMNTLRDAVASTPAHVADANE